MVDVINYETSNGVALPTIDAGLQRWQLHDLRFLRAIHWISLLPTCLKQHHQLPTFQPDNSPNSLFCKGRHHTITPVRYLWEFSVLHMDTSIDSGEIWSNNPSHCQANLPPSNSLYSGSETKEACFHSYTSLINSVSIKTSILIRQKGLSWLKRLN